MIRERESIVWYWVKKRHDNLGQEVKLHITASFEQDQLPFPLWKQAIRFNTGDHHH